MSKEEKTLFNNSFDGIKKPRNRAKLSDILRDNVYNDIINRIGCSMFDWSGFPEDVTEDITPMFMELAINCGAAVFYKVPSTVSTANKNRWACTPVGWTGQLRNDGTAEHFITHGTDYAVTDEQLDKYIIIKNNSYMDCEYINTEWFASMLSDTDKAERALIRWCRLTPVARANSGVEAGKLEEILKRVYEGTPWAVLSDDTKMLTGQPMSRDDSTLRLTDESAIEKMHFLSEFHYELVRRICNLYNIPFHTTAKSAQNLESEIHNTDIFSKMLTPDRLSEREKAAKKFKEVFGWDISVKLSECFEQENEVIDSNVQEEINEAEQTAEDNTPDPDGAAETEPDPETEDNAEDDET